MISFGQTAAGIRQCAGFVLNVSLSSIRILYTNTYWFVATQVLSLKLLTVSFVTVEDNG